MPINNVLATAPSLPKVARVLGVGTNYQEFGLKQSSLEGKVTVIATHACIVSFSSDGVTDGDPATNLDRIELTQTQAIDGAEFLLPGGPLRASSVLVAAQAGTVDVTVVQE
jgi:hypothetical protein